MAEQSIINIQPEKTLADLKYVGSQTNFILAKGLTLIAKDAQEVERQALPIYFSIRNKNRMNKSIRITPATKQTLESEVREIDDFLAEHEYGAVRKPYKQRSLFRRILGVGLPSQNTLDVPTEDFLAKGIRTQRGKIKKGQRVSSLTKHLRNNKSRNVRRRKRVPFYMITKKGKHVLAIRETQQALSLIHI